uniref:Uncharacterized protein n=1 Tax=Physcomitrium patens TaxID=3218 RepID=A0A2K1K1U3_PHYPA|nr:hypothetical protein PHYPA_012215 [Physcomitrium patens]
MQCMITLLVKLHTVYRNYAFRSKTTFENSPCQQIHFNHIITISLSTEEVVFCSMSLEKKTSKLKMPENECLNSDKLFTKFKLPRLF